MGPTQENPTPIQPNPGVPQPPLNPVAPPPSYPAPNPTGPGPAPMPPPTTPPPSSPFPPAPQSPIDNGQPPKQAKSVMGPLIVISVVAVVVLLVVLIIGLSNNKKNSKNTTGKSSSSKGIAPGEVTIDSGGFEPSTITVVVGQGVVWTNKTTANYEVNSDPYPNDNTLPNFNEKTPIAENGAYSYVFAKTGTYTYHDDLNPSLKGTVIVKQ
jgi:plastocyanin